MTDSSSASVSSLFVGIDVAKDKLDLARSDSNQILTVANDPAGIRQIVDSLRPTPPTMIVVEATGGLERAVLDALIGAGLPVALVNPGQVRHFAKGIGILAKTDTIDAGVLVQYARLAAPRLTEKRSKNQADLDALVTCRRQLTHVRTEQANRRGRTINKPALKAIDAVPEQTNRRLGPADPQAHRIRR